MSRRDKRVLLSFTACELAEVDSAADAAGVARASMLRRLALAYARGEIITASAANERYDDLVARVAALEKSSGV